MTLDLQIILIARINMRLWDTGQTYLNAEVLPVTPCMSAAAAANHIIENGSYRLATAANYLVMQEAMVKILK